jgi:hypothetical protein
MPAAAWIAMKYFVPLKEWWNQCLYTSWLSFGRGPEPILCFVCADTISTQDPFLVSLRWKRLPERNEHHYDGKRNMYYYLHRAGWHEAVIGRRSHQYINQLGPW